jgi:hypothetical protein
VITFRGGVYSCYLYFLEKPSPLFNFYHGVAQNKPATGTYRRLENTDDPQEMQAMAAAAPQPQPTQPIAQPPPYIGYVQVPATPAAFQQQASNNVSMHVSLIIL